MDLCQRWTGTPDIKRLVPLESVANWSTKCRVWSSLGWHVLRSLVIKTAFGRRQKMLSPALYYGDELWVFWVCNCYGILFLCPLNSQCISQTWDVSVVHWVCRFGVSKDGSIPEQLDAWRTSTTKSSHWEAQCIPCNKREIGPQDNRITEAIKTQ